MNTGNFVTSILFPESGIVVRKWVVEENVKVFPESYQFTIDLLNISGRVITLDIHEGDEWKVIS